MKKIINRHISLDKFSFIVLLLAFFLSSCNKNFFDFFEREPVRHADYDEIVKAWEKAKKDYVETEAEDFFSKVSQNAPVSLKDGMEKLKNDLSEKDIETFKSLKEEDSVGMHFGFGMGLRNSWGLWHNTKIAQYLYSRGVFHPDSMSGVIIRSFMKYIRGEDYKLEADNKYPDHFKIVDAIINHDNKLLNKLTKNLKKLPENGDLPTALDVAARSCNSEALLILDKFSLRAQSGYTGCEPEFFVDLFKKKQELLNNEAWVIYASGKSGVISEFCDVLPKFSKETNQNIFSEIIVSGNNDDFICIKNKYEDIPEIKLNHFAANNLSEEKYEFLIRNMNPEIFSTRERVVATLAQLSDKDKVFIKKFIEVAKITQEELNDRSFLYRSMRRKDVDVLEILLENGFSPNYVVDEQEGTLLDIAILKRNPVAIDYLIEKGAQPDFKKHEYYISSIIRMLDQKMMAFLNNSVSPELIIKYLVAVKNLKVRGKSQNYLPINSFIYYLNTDTLKFLKHYGCDFSFKSDEYNVPIYFALLNKDKTVFDWLIEENGHNINQVNINGDSAIHESVMDSNIENLKFLLNRKAKSDIKNKEGQTPLALAKLRLEEEKNRHLEYVERMKKMGESYHDGFHDIHIKEINEIIELLSNPSTE